MSLKNLIHKSLLFLTVILLGNVAVSCTDTEETDSSKFMLYYCGVTDIGPSMDFSLESPSYIGGQPSNFSITQITLNGEPCATDCFVINEETGAIQIQHTANLATGTYRLSVACHSNGKYYEIKDAVQVNMLLAVPEGVKVTPAEVIVNMDTDNFATEAFAQVETTGAEHVSIKGYAIAEDDSKDYLNYFTIDGKGKIMIKSKHQNKLIPGKSYTLGLKLTTNAGSHLYPDAVTFKVISKPRHLLYAPNEVNVDKGFAHESEKPTIQGSLEGIKYSIKSVTPETQAFTIDETTGVIKLAENNGLEISETPYIIDVTVSNEQGATDFEKAYTVNIVKYTAPIQPETFGYDACEIFKGGEATQQLKEGFVGGSPFFEFDNNKNSEEVQAQIAKNKIELNAETGAVAIHADNTLAPATYDIHVKVSNSKPATGEAIFRLTIKKNPNDFTFVSYGTNLEHGMPAEGEEIVTKAVLETNPDNRNQFRFINRTNFANTFNVLGNDLPKNATTKFEIVKKFPENKGKFAATTIDPTKGTLTLGENPFTKQDYEGGILLIKVTCSGQNAPTISKTFPVFFSTPKNDNKKLETMIFSPIAVKANPRTGKCGNTECKVIKWERKKFNGYQDDKQLVMDYRSDHAFYDFSNNSKHGSGEVTESSSLLIQNVWKKYQSNIGMGSRAPMSFYTEQEKIASKAAYIDPTSRQIKVNPEKWMGSDGEYANGAVMAQIRYRIDGKTEEADFNSAIAVFPVFIWLDENF